MYMLLLTETDRFFVALLKYEKNFIRLLDIKLERLGDPLKILTK